MSFGDGNLRERVEELERQNNTLWELMRDYRGRWVARGAAIAKQKERIGELEALVRDLYAEVESEVTFVDPDGNRVPEMPWAAEYLKPFRERMAELGIEAADER